MTAEKSTKDRKANHALLKNREQTAERTRVSLQHALDRFEHCQLLRLPEDSKLTVRNLAEEADVAKDTAFARHQKGHQHEGQHRFPDVVARFAELKRKLKKRHIPKQDPRENQIAQIRERVTEMDQWIVKLNIANETLSHENYELKKKIEEIRDQNEKLRQENHGKLITLLRCEPREGEES